MSKKKYLCPVCGYRGLTEPPYDRHNSPSYEICLCCGFEFGFDAANSQEAFSGYRKKWLEKGSPWFMPKLKPKGWHLEKQLDKLAKSNHPDINFTIDRD